MTKGHSTRGEGHKHKGRALDRASSTTMDVDEQDQAARQEPPLEGAGADDVEPSPGERSEPPGPASIRGSAEVPWEAKGRGHLAAVARTLDMALRRPTSFFEAVAKGEDRWAAFGFALLLDVLGHVLALGWVWAFSGAFDALSLVAVVISPLRVLIFVWLGSEVVHSVLRTLGAAAASRAVTHRTVAYCYGVATAYRNVLLVPLVEAAALALPEGAAAQTLEVVVLLALFVAPFVAYESTAIRVAHRASRPKAWAAVLASWGLLAALAVLVFLSGGGLEGES